MKETVVGWLKFIDTHWLVGGSMPQWDRYALIATDAILEELFDHQRKGWNDKTLVLLIISKKIVIKKQYVLLVKNGCFCFFVGLFLFN